MTASRTWRSRSVRDVAMLPTLLATNNFHGRPGVGQVAHQRVEAEPAFRSAGEPPIPDLHPASRCPGGNGRQLAVTGGKADALSGPQRQVQPLEFPLPRREDLLGPRGRAAS